jgi:formylglycine-generating enzyme required for sulfatase activity
MCPGEFPETYGSFAARVDRHIEKSLEQITLFKTEVTVAEFRAFVERTGMQPGRAALDHCAFIIGGNNR